MMIEVFPGALLTATLLAGHGLRKGSLSISGAIAAFLVGYITLANHVRSFGITLLVFYIVGSRATKVGHSIKAKLEVEKENATNDKQDNHKSSSGGKRDAWQVLCNSLVSATSALAFRILYTETYRNWIAGKAWCLFNISRGKRILGVEMPPRTLFLLMLGHFACCMGDTLASEFGILAKGPPRLVLPPFRIVPPGTNGGISLQGTIASLSGGAFIGAVASSIAVFLDNQACSSSKFVILFNCIVLGLLGGLLGSLLDSLLGATLQQTWYNNKSKQVLLGTPKDRSNVAKDWQIITGQNLLSNNAVNFISSAITAISISYIGNHYFKW